MDMGGATAGGMKAETADKTKAIQNMGAFSKIGNKPVIHLLVQIEAGFVAGEEVSLELQTIQVHRNQAAQFSCECPMGLGQTFELAGSDITPLDDGPRGEYRGERGNNHGFSLLHG